jgi:transposase
VIVIGIDAHKRSHTAVAVDGGTGQQLAETTVEADDFGHQKLLVWATKLDPERRWAIEDCRNVSRRLEASLLRAGELVARVPPKMMAKARDAARTFGKSDPIDALAVAQAALRRPDLPVARLAGPEREIALLLDHRANLVVERTRHASRLRWLVHELDPNLNPAARSLDVAKVVDRLKRKLNALDPTALRRIALDLLARIRDLNAQIKQLERDLGPLVRRHAAPLLQIPGVGIINAARLLAEVAGVGRFKTDAQLATYAGCAPLDASSGRQIRHRLNRTGNRQFNSAVHIIALTQARVHPPARDYLARRRTEGKTRREAIRALKRHIIRVLFRLLNEIASRAALQVSPSGGCLT